MASGAAKVAYGASLGTGANLDVRTVGFRPRSVEIINVSSADQLKWIDGMADGAGLKTVAAGTSTILATLGVTPLSDGFRLGTDADLNVDGETVRWVATE